MKIFNRLVIVAIVFLVFGGCQKELNFDGVSVGTLKSALTGDCSPITVNGLYQEDSVLNSDNWVDVQINASFGGSYEIKTDTVNGFSFYRAGEIPSGLNTIRIFATGTPDTAIATTFTVMYDSTYCTFTINVLASTVGGAHFNLGGAPGTCSMFTVYGTYNATTPANAGDSVTFLVNVTQPGTYNINSGPAINGLTFSAIGSFPNMGIATVTLHASGTPTSNGTFTYSPTGDGSTCTFPVNVGGGTPATYTLGGNPGSCTGVVLTGTYRAGTPTHVINNSARVDVNVTVLGTYDMSTTTVNNVKFAASGSFTTLGSQTVTLLADGGTPTAAGTFSYPITATGVSTTCSFPITYSAASTNADYIPQTVGSNWTDSLVGGTPADTAYYKVNPNTVVLGTPAQTYAIFQQLDNTLSPIDSFFHRKSGGLYYQFYETDPFGFFDGPFNKDALILDSTKAVAGTWSVDLGPNTAIGGILTFIDVKYDAQILAKGATAVIFGTTYNNVIKVKYTYSGDLGAGPMVIASEERWYAKGFGLIYDKAQDEPPTTVVERITKRIQIL